MEDAGAILSLGIDGKYAQSVVEVAIHSARMKGAGLVTIYPFEHSLGLFADEWLRPEPGEATQRLVRSLVEIVSGENPPNAISGTSGHSDQLNRAAQILREASHPVILLGSDFLTHLDLGELLPSVQALIDATGASLVLLPQEGNLTGALMFASLFPPAGKKKIPTELIYLIGVDVSPDTPNLVRSDLSEHLSRFK